jgi:Methyltransferase domain
MQNTLDIGIYRGRSFFPQALAHALFTRGKVYGIDPYSNAEAVQKIQQPEMQTLLDDFAADTDFESIYCDVAAFLVEHQLEKNGIILRMRSDEAFKYFIKENVLFDLIHIDGNHESNQVMRDVEMSLELLLPNGYLIIDDISWESVQLALKLAMNNAEVVKIDEIKGYIILKKSN